MYAARCWQESTGRLCSLIPRWWGPFVNLDRLFQVQFSGPRHRTITRLIVIEPSAVGIRDSLFRTSGTPLSLLFFFDFIPTSTPVCVSFHPLQQGFCLPTRMKLQFVALLSHLNLKIASHWNRRALQCVCTQQGSVFPGGGEKSYSTETICKISFFFYR